MIFANTTLIIRFQILYHKSEMFNPVFLLPQENYCCSIFPPGPVIIQFSPPLSLKAAIL